jgi:thiamine biosynthesis lipoprotein
MGTIISIDVVGTGGDAEIEQAFAWLRDIERRCNRFDPTSELRQIGVQAGVAVAVSDVLFAALEFAWAVADDTSGAFDPTVGGLMVREGFTRDYRTGLVVATPVSRDGPVSYRDVVLDADERTVMVTRPLVFDLGAVAKGLAIDLAVRALAPLEHFAIDAGGDLYLAGLNDTGEPWKVGIRHPRADDGCIEMLRVSDAAVCTSGDYERRAPGREHVHHIMDPRRGTSASDVVSTTVVAPTAMLADALATAAFVLGPTHGLDLLKRHGVEGLILSSALTPFETPGLRTEFGDV